MEKSWFHWTFEINCQEAPNPSACKEFNCDHSRLVELVLRRSQANYTESSCSYGITALRFTTLWFHIAKIHR